MSNTRFNSISFYRGRNQADNRGTYLCPACDLPVIFHAYWPGVPRIETILRSHFDDCRGTNSVPDPLLFLVNDTSTGMNSGLAVVDRRISTSAYAAAYQSDPTDQARYLRIARAAIHAAQSPKEIARVVVGLFESEYEGVRLSFEFTDNTRFVIHEQHEDTSESLTLKAFRRFFRPIRKTA